MRKFDIKFLMILGLILFTSLAQGFDSFENDAASVLQSKRWKHYEQIKH